MNLMKRDRENLWDPFYTLSDLQNEMNRLFSSSLNRVPRDAAAFPEIDFREDEHEYVLKADLPGIRKEDLDLSVRENMLVLKGERKGEQEQKGKNFHYVERWTGAFQRVIEFPTDIDAQKVKATFKDGVLELTAGKAENAKPRQIQIEVK